MIRNGQSPLRRSTDFPFAGASLLAMVVDDIALNQMARGALGFFASNLAPTGNEQEPKKKPYRNPIGLFSLPRPGCYRPMARAASAVYWSGVNLPSLRIGPFFASLVMP
ncbi:hypothetical protein EQV97_04270 [Pseudomonas sp. TMW22090]|nr:hypothetical protein [Pseudomonas sp. TMW22090]